MMKHLYRMAFILVFGAGFAMAQTGMQNPPSTPPTFPAQQQVPPTMQHPDESTGQAGAVSTTTLPKAQADIQSALRRQLPASADSVTVSVTDDNKIQLSGTVTSEIEKAQIEQIAHSAAPDLSIVNKLQVANSPMGPVTSPTGVTPPNNNPEGKTGTEKTSQPTSPRQPMPPMGSSFMSQQSGSPQYPSASPNPQYPSTSPNNGGMSNQTPQANTAMSSAETQSNIQKALQQDQSLSKANITVSVLDNKKVELTGTVANKDQKKAAKQIAESNAGGMKVVDHLKVEGAKENSTPQKY